MMGKKEQYRSDLILGFGSTNQRTAQLYVSYFPPLVALSVGLEGFSNINVLGYHAIQEYLKHLLFNNGPLIGKHHC